MTSFSSESVNRIIKALTGVIADYGEEVEFLRNAPVDHSCGIVDRQVTRLMDFLNNQENNGRRRVNIDEITDIFATDPADD